MVAGKCDRNGQEICLVADNERTRLIVTTPIVVGSVELGRIRVILSARAVLSHLREIQRNGVYIGLGFWLFAAGIGYWLAGYLTGPVQRFMEVADSISRGDFTVPIPKVRWVDELSRLSRALQTMTSAIANRELELQRSEKKFRNLFERAIEGIFMADANGRLLDFNPAFLKILGADSQESMLERNLFANIFENEEALFNFHRRMAEQGLVKNHELALIKGDSTATIVSLTCHVVRKKDGAILLYEGLIRDITAQKNAEREIVRMRNYLNNIIESMPSMLVTMDGDWEVTQWNGAASRLVGLASTDAVGRNIYDVFPFLSQYAGQIETVNRQHIPLTLYRQRVIRDTEHLYDITLFPLIANGVNGIAIRLDDITELEVKEQQLRQAQKMESIGVLAGGLAHDFNNVLAAMLGNLSLLQFKLGTTGNLSMDEMQQGLAQMESAGQRAVDMVRQLLTLSRRNQCDLVPVDLNLTVKHVRKLGENTFDKSVQVVIHPAEGPAYVLADTTEMEQVLLNLCINGIHAMTIMRGEGSVWGGTLTIALEQVMGDPLFRKRYPDAAADTYWKLSVTDTGVGIDPKEAAKIFEPFFTTKKQGQGSGLGLAMVYNIVRQQQGFMDVYSEPGQGSTFSVYLPVLVREGISVPSAEASLAISRGEGVVLVVDDDAVVRDMAENILKIAGYTVLTAENGLDGVEKYRRNQSEIKAVLLDMAMPVMSGREAFAEMKKINPDVKVLLASGFRKDNRVEEVLAQGVKDFLQKPYTMAGLTLAMKKVIDS
jgi:PAS domain S-box-containing protein